MADEQQTQQQQQTDGTNGADGTNGTQTGSQTGTQTQQQEPPDEKRLTQAEVNAILKREKATWQKTLEEERKKAEMTEAERLKAEKAAAEKRVTETQAASNARIIKTEARAALADAGVKAERRDYALRMLDLSGVEVSDGGEVDSKTLSAAVDALLKDVPELKGATGGGAAGSEFGGNGQQTDPGNMTMQEYGAWRKTQGL